MTIGVVSLVSTIVPMAIGVVTISISSRGVVSLVGVFSVSLAVAKLPLTVFLLPYVVVQSDSLV
jgi:hypothetical protein